MIAISCPGICYCGPVYAAVLAQHAAAHVEALVWCATCFCNFALYHERTLLFGKKTLQTFLLPARPESEGKDFSDRLRWAPGLLTAIKIIMQHV